MLDRVGFVLRRTGAGVLAGVVAAGLLWAAPAWADDEESAEPDLTAGEEQALAEAAETGEPVEVASATPSASPMTTCAASPRCGLPTST
ncbi:hypothetical protein, partial [Thermobifida halotolerans]|uniref:hypothetical protein n=1 Tax=Thermobifida halotolerans TaxID=483545 RepID=UPI0018FECAAD